jgi:hypothetical protein
LRQIDKHEKMGTLFTEAASIHGKSKGNITMKAEAQFVS